MKIALALLVVAGALLRIHGAGWPLTQDEALTWWAARSGIVEFLTWRHHPEHAPLSFALVRLTVAALGTDTEWALRLPSLLAGVLAIPAAFAVGRRLRSPVGGIWLAALVTFDPLLIQQARTARMYSTLLLLTLLALLLVDRLVAGRERGGWRPALGIVLAALLWTHPLGLAVWAGVGAAFLGAGDLRSLRRGIATAFGVAVALGAVGLGRLALRSPGTSIGSGGLAEPAALVLQRVSELAGGGLLGWLVIAVGLIGLVGLLRRAGSRPLALALVVIGGISILSAILAAVERPWGIDRYLILLHLTTFAGLAGLASSARRAAALAGTGAALLATLAALPWIARSPMPAHAPGALARGLAEVAGPGDAVTYLPTYLFRIGGYYGLPYRPVVLDPDGELRHPWPRARTWVLVAHPRALPTAVPGQTGSRDPRDDDRLEALFGVYGVEYDPGNLVRMLERRSAVAIELDSTGIRYLSD